MLWRNGFVLVSIEEEEQEQHDAGQVLVSWGPQLPDWFYAA